MCGRGKGVATNCNVPQGPAAEGPDRVRASACVQGCMADRHTHMCANLAWQDELLEIQEHEDAAAHDAATAAEAAAHAALMDEANLTGVEVRGYGQAAAC